MTRWSRRDRAKEGRCGEQAREIRSLSLRRRKKGGRGERGQKDGGTVPPWVLLSFHRLALPISLG